MVPDRYLVLHFWSNSHQFNQCVIGLSYSWGNFVAINQLISFVKFLHYCGRTIHNYRIFLLFSYFHFVKCLVFPVLCFVK